MATRGRKPGNRLERQRGTRPGRLTPGGEQNRPAHRAAVRHAAQLERRARAWQLFVEHEWTMQQIADELGVSNKTICTDIWAVADERAATAARLADHWRQVELERQAMHDRQILPLLVGQVPERQVVVTKTVRRKGKRHTLRVVQGVPVSPDRVALIQLRAHERLDASGRRRDRLLGLEMPLKVAPTNPTGDRPYRELSFEDLQSLLEQREQDLRGRGVIDVPAPRELTGSEG